ncbi:hypothetical protein BO71DRAFT_78669 [Aspergillus ellipticus CBS 707.79]|uniref:Secreted protein CSS2 C-terminal domain-containing protein n=1 Tax=Aspergillus ellipticus CBS 707.79 TaxID=1448320 RepID=A0A319DKP4_9EURO|nr:hypothetical protein BO71DRAFT_78669 [Aspergillus ellipticus CBS 707.79]
MVRLGWFGLGLVACLLADPCHAGNHDPAPPVIPSTIAETEPTAQINRTWTMGSLYADSQTTLGNLGGSVREGLESFGVGQMALDTYEYVAGLVSPKKPMACTLMYDTMSTHHTDSGYAFQATITYPDCDHKEDRAVVMEKVAECARDLKSQEARMGCCRFSRRGRWRLLVQLGALEGPYRAELAQC